MCKGLHTPQYREHCVSGDLLFTAGTEDKPISPNPCCSSSAPALRVGGPLLQPWESQHLSRRGIFLLPPASGIRGWSGLMGTPWGTERKTEGESQGQGWLGETLHIRMPLSAHTFYRSCSELAESAQKHEGELSNVELLHKLRGARWRTDRPWSSSGVLSTLTSEPFLSQSLQEQPHRLAWAPQREHSGQAEFSPGQPSPCLASVEPSDSEPQTGRPMESEEGPDETQRTESHVLFSRGPWFLLKRTG